jgi:starch phosphorylase
MKLALNGALTIGTEDGANIEIAEQVGHEHMFTFGLRAPEVAALRREGYDPMKVYAGDAAIREVLDAIASGRFSPDEPERHRGIVNALLWGGDHYLLLADFQSYLAAQRRVDEHYRNPEAWRHSALLNVAGMGVFSSDRTIRDYAERIWHVRARH